VLNQSEAKQANKMQQNKTLACSGARLKVNVVARQKVRHSKNAKLIF